MHFAVIRSKFTFIALATALAIASARCRTVERGELSDIERLLISAIALRCRIPTAMRSISRIRT